LPGSVRQYYSLDVTVNGEFIGALDNFSHLEMPKSHAEQSYELGADSAEFLLGEGIKDVCIHLPWSFCAMGVLLDVEERIREIAREFSNVFVIPCFYAIPHEEEYFGDLKLHPQ